MSLHEWIKESLRWSSRKVRLVDPWTDRLNRGVEKGMIRLRMRWSVRMARHWVLNNRGKTACIVGGASKAWIGFATIIGVSVAVLSLPPFLILSWELQKTQKRLGGKFEVFALTMVLAGNLIESISGVVLLAFKWILMIALGVELASVGAEAAFIAWLENSSMAPKSKWLLLLGLNPLCIANWMDCPSAAEWEGVDRGFNGLANPVLASYMHDPVGWLNFLAFAALPWRTPAEIMVDRSNGINYFRKKASQKMSLQKAKSQLEKRVLGTELPKVCEKMASGSKRL